MSPRPARWRMAVWSPVLLLLLVSPVSAQAASDTTWVRTSPFLLKYGKWVSLAAAVGMGLKAASAHRAADRAFDRLDSYCSVDPTRCDQKPNGDYIDPVAEGYYQTSLRHDRRARGWLLGGEVTLLGTAGLFIWELSRPKHPPRNIPFEPSFSVVGGTTRLGIQVPF